ncbi:MAG: amidase family protein [Chloroflexota bacterium]
MLLGAHLGQLGLEYYGQAQNIRRTYRRAYDAVFEQVDCLVMPTVPIKAPRFVEPTNSDDVLRSLLDRKPVRVVTRNVTPFNLTGHPALTIPCPTPGTLPVGVMLVGRHFSDGLVLRVGYALDRLHAREQAHTATAPERIGRC